ncbi:hypothetical protein NPIL_253691 [Nephila pilipes]|uniref:Uncharacterized protein n=1 Tax=Nephila pilipes TaxID=299642 RepID=A0A8X6T5T4_NEPPI|nr:hypothetical protein NPIL_253691 [Nephila pilipes]
MYPLIIGNPSSLSWEDLSDGLLTPDHSGYGHMFCFWGRFCLPVCLCWEATNMKEGSVSVSEEWIGSTLHGSDSEKHSDGMDTAEAGLPQQPALPTPHQERMWRSQKYSDIRVSDVICVSWMALGLLLVALQLGWTWEDQCGKWDLI